MPARKHRTVAPLAVKALELSAAVPQVVAHRVTRMALAGTTMSERDRKEFKLMVAEKQSAFSESFARMGLQAMRENQAMALSWLRSVGPGSSRGRRAPLTIGAQLHEAMLGVLAEGMAPIHRKAVANAKRLAKTRLR